MRKARTALTKLLRATVDGAEAVSRATFRIMRGGLDRLEGHDDTGGAPDNGRDAEPTDEEPPGTPS